MRTLLKSILGQDTGTDQFPETKYSRFDPRPGAHRAPQPVAGDALTRMKVKQNIRLTHRLIREDPELAPQSDPAVATAEQLSNDGIDQIPLSVLVKALPGKVNVIQRVSAPKMSLA